MSLEEVKSVDKKEELKSLQLKDCIGWTQDFSQYPEVISYLTRNNCMEAYQKEPNRFFYDKVQDRVVFVEYDTINSFKLATGRNISSYGRNVPKWFKYVAVAGEYFIIGNGDNSCDTWFICEDCASASSLSRLGVGLGLCGTSYNLYALVSKLDEAKNVVICLDPDAQIKALRLQRDLNGLGKFNSVRAAQLSNDPKYFSAEQLKKELNYEQEKDNQNT